MSLSRFEIQEIAIAIAEQLAGHTVNDSMLDSHRAAELLACSVPTIERLTRTGEIPSVKVGRLRRYRRSELMAMKIEKRGAE